MANTHSLPCCFRTAAFCAVAHLGFVQLASADDGSEAVETRVERGENTEDAEAAAESDVEALMRETESTETDKEEIEDVPRPKRGPGSLPPLVWKPEFRRFGVVDGVISLSFGVTVGLARALGPRGGGPTQAGRFDESVRNALRSPGFHGRLRAADVSDVLLGLSVSYALLGDPLINAGWLRDSPDAGKQLALLNAEVVAVTLGVQQLTANLIGRERPYGRTCGTNELDADTHRCEGGDRYRSHFSGHTSVPFSVAAATCVNHAYLPLSGGNAWVACLSGFALAATTGTLRIVSDYHYATDVLVGAAVGTAIGVAFPLSRYLVGRDALSVETSSVSARFLPGYGGIGTSGRPVAGLTVMGVLK